MPVLQVDQGENGFLLVGGPGNACRCPGLTTFTVPTLDHDNATAAIGF